MYVPISAFLAMSKLAKERIPKLAETNVTLCLCDVVGRLSFEGPAACLKADSLRDGFLHKADPPAPRAALIHTVFQLCDTDGDGFLNEHESLVFVRFTGYDGDKAQWSEDFGHFCVDLGADPEDGVNLAALERLVNGSSEIRLYCADADLQSICTELHLLNLLDQ